MTAIEKIELLREQIKKVEEKYCENAKSGTARIVGRRWTEMKTMDDLISKQLVIDIIEQRKKIVLGEREWHEGIAYGYAMAHRDLADIFKQLPSVQPEIVRCEACRWYDKSTASGTYEPIAHKCILHQRFTIGIQFCSDGERQEEDDLQMCANHYGERREE